MFEEAASAEGIVRQAQKLGLPVSLSAKQIFDAAYQGDKKALAVVEQEGNGICRDLPRLGERGWSVTIIWDRWLEPGIQACTIMAMCHPTRRWIK